MDTDAYSTSFHRRSAHEIESEEDASAYQKFLQRVGRCPALATALLLRRGETP